MKSLLFVLIALASSNAMAMKHPPILIKTTHSGYTEAHLVTQTRCEIYPDKIVLTLTAGYMESKQERKIQLNDAIYKTIKEAAKGTLTKSAASQDGPSIVYTAGVLLPNDGTKVVELGSNNDSTGSDVQNSSPWALTLRQFLDMNCGTEPRL